MEAFSYSLDTIQCLRIPDFTFLYLVCWAQLHGLAAQGSGKVRFGKPICIFNFSLSLLRT